MRRILRHLLPLQNLFKPDKPPSDAFKWVMTAVVYTALAGCVGYRATIPVHPDFIPYIEQFEAACDRPVHDVAVVYGLLDGASLGLCRKQGPRRSIFIDPYKWGDLGDLEREWIIFHELGHCALDKPHDEGYSASCPTSMMYPLSFGASPCYQANREYYIDNLCRR